MSVKNKLLRRHSKFGLPFIAIVVVAVLLIGGGTYALLFSSGPDTSSSPVDLQKSLVGWWKFDGNAKDSTPHANNGAITGATLTTDREGAANSAYSFNGTSSNIAIGNLPYTKSLPFSASAWFKINGIGTGALINKYTSGSWNGFNLFFSSGKLCSWYLTGTVNNNYTAISQDAGVGSVACASPSSSVWHNVVVSVDASTGMKMYLDGTLFASDSWHGSSGNSSESTTLNFGNYFSSYFNGSLDDMRLYSRVLSATEATALYKEYNPGVAVASGAKSLIGWWKMDGNGKDATPYGDNGTVSNATLTTDREGASNSAYSFNGSSSNILVPSLAGGNISTNTITFTAWVYPNSIPGTAYTGLVYSRNGTQSVGISLGSDGKYLSYTWNNNSASTYSWNNGLDLVANKWNFIALSISPSAATAYLGVTGAALQSAVNSISHVNQTLNGAFEIGEDALGSRFFNGKMDDVRIYNRSLSSSDMTNLYSSYNSQISLGGSGISGGVNLTQGLVGEWNFSGNAKDSTPYSNNGTVSGATLTTDRHGNANGAYSFNGSNQYISLPTVIQPHVTLSVSAWFKTSSTSGAIIGYQNAAVGSTPSNYIPLLYVGSDGKLRGEFWQGAVAPITSSGTVNSGTWHHVVIIGNTSTQSMYLDNSLVGTLAGTINQLSMTTNQIGTAYSNGWPSASSSWMYFNGSIDDVRVYNRVLSVAEVSALYNEYQ